MSDVVCSVDLAHFEQLSVRPEEGSKEPDAAVCSPGLRWEGRTEERVSCLILCHGKVLLRCLGQRHFRSGLQERRREDEKRSESKG